MDECSMSPSVIDPLTIDKNKHNAVVEHRGERMPTPTDLLEGSVDLLLLGTIALEPMQRWSVARRIQHDVLEIGEGPLYPALHRLEYREWIKTEWGNSRSNRRAKYYKLTVTGRRQLLTERATWDRLSAAIAPVLTATQEATS
jgi:PadR family transcriptional regulator, regulatory protein PadR